MLDKKFSDMLVSLFERYLSFYKQFLSLEKRKYEDIKSDRLGILDSTVNEEQAFLLKARGMEAERESLLKGTPYKNSTFRELIPLFGELERERVSEIYEELSKVVLNIKDTNSSCSDLTTLKLRRTRAELRKLESNPELQKVYDARAREHLSQMSLISRKA
ncbi:MAG: flagellar export chaperone FlgN [Bacillota bacterium]|nr:flagellar export chaperone FlgN [Bacillota bacterium]